MDSTKKKPVCKYGGECYRKNPNHFEDYFHPKRKLEEDIGEHNKPKKKQKKEKEDVMGPMDKFFTKKEQVESPQKSQKAEHEFSTSEEESCNEEEVGNAEFGNVSSNEEISYPDSPGNIKENIRQKYKMDMPKDLYDFWDFCKSLNPTNPLVALEENLELTLVGPFDLLALRHRKKRKNRCGKIPNYMLHWRYYYDPPEFTTVIKGSDAEQFHLGYFRDDPEEMPIFVAANSAGKDCKLVPKGSNLFAAVQWCIDHELKSEHASKKNLEQLLEKLKDAAEAGNYGLEEYSKEMRQREKKLVCKTFHGVGMMVPYDAETEIGYRPVPETPASLKKMLKNIVESKTEKERNENFDPLQEIITLVQFANDECDYGEGLELGLNIFSYGDNIFNSTVNNLLPMAYQLLGRLQFKDIAVSHMKNRKHNPNLSQID